MEILAYIDDKYSKKGWALLDDEDMKIFQELIKIMDEHKRESLIMLT